MNHIAKAETHQSEPALVSMIERVALDPNVSIEKLERMLDMKERLESKAAEQAFAAAFAAASADMPTIPKNGMNQHTNVPYALLKDIIGLTRPVLSRNGLGLNFNVEVTDKQVKVTAILSHVGGYSRSTTIVLPVDAGAGRNAVQAIGSSQTYGQRYAAQAILGLALGDDVDDDGHNADSGITDEQYKALRAELKRSGSDEAKFLAYFRISHLAELRSEDFKRAIAMLRQKGQK